MESLNYRRIDSLCPVAPKLSSESIHIPTHKMTSTSVQVQNKLMEMEFANISFLQSKENAFGNLDFEELELVPRDQTLMKVPIIQAQCGIRRIPLSKGITSVSTFSLK